MGSDSYRSIMILFLQRTCYKDINSYLTGGNLRRKVSYELVMTGNTDKEKPQMKDISNDKINICNKEFRNHIKESLLKVLLENQKINRWQYEESIKQLKKGG